MESYLAPPEGRASGAGRGIPQERSVRAAPRRRRAPNRTAAQPQGFGVQNQPLRRLRHSTALYVLPFALVYFLAGCSWISGETEVELQLPELPADWDNLGPIVAEVQVLSAGAVSETTVVKWEPARAFPLLLPKERVTPVLVTPRPSAAGVLPKAAARAPWSALRPAAAIYPHTVTSEGAMHASWLVGAAVVELEPITRAYGWSWFNLGRILSELRYVEARSAWWLEWQRIRERLWEHRFRSSYLSQQELHEVSVEVPAGEWIPQDPFLESIWAGGGDAAEEAAAAAAAETATAAAAVDATSTVRCTLPAGLHRYLQPEPGRRLEIYVNERGEATTMVRDN